MSARAAAQTTPKANNTPAHRFPVGAAVVVDAKLYTIAAADGYSYTEAGSAPGRTTSVWSARPPRPDARLVGPVVPCYRLLRRGEKGAVDEHPRFVDKTTPAVPEHALRQIDANELAS